MSSLYANSINETQKIFQRKKTVIFLTMTGIIPAGAAALIVFSQNALGIFAVNSASFPILMLGLFSSILLPLFIFSTAADLFSGELNDKTLKLTLTRPITRFKVFLSKNLSLGVYIIISLGLLFVISVISGLFFEGGGLATPNLFQNIVAYIAALVPLFFLGVTAVFLAQFFKNSGAALTTCIIVYLAGKAVPFLSPILTRINPFSYTNWHIMWIGSSVSTGRLFNIFLIFLSCTMILFALGFYLFDRKDI